MTEKVSILQWSKSRGGDDVATPSYTSTSSRSLGRTEDVGRGHF